MATNTNGQTTNCGKPYAHAWHTHTIEFSLDPTEEYDCDGVLWTPVPC